MIRIQCTSCKKTLEADENTLSNREASVVRCPSCGVTLLVDKRKTSVVGPDVRVATDEYKPLSAQPPAGELDQTAPAGAHIAIIADLYGVAENHLRVRDAIRDRTGKLSALALGARDALGGMHVSLPPPSSDGIVRAVTAAPNEPRLDGQLTSLDTYLQASRKIVDAAAGIWRNVMARHSYRPIVEWQTEARAAVAGAYGVVATRKRDYEPCIARLQNVQSKYERLVNQYHSELSAHEATVAAVKSRIATLDNENIGAQSRLSDLETAANKNATEAAKGGGCASAVVATIIGIVTAVSMKSGAAGWMAFFLTLAGGCWLAWQLGFAKNKRERERADNALSLIRSHQVAAARELRDAEKTLNEHKSATPDIAPLTAWSLLTSPDFDPETAPRAVEAAGMDRLQVKREPEPERTTPVADVPAALLNPTATMSVQGLEMSAGGTAARSVGFIPQQISAASTATAGMVIPAPLPIAADPATPAAVARPAGSNRRFAAVIVASSVVILVVSYLVWSSAFSYSARINKALAAGQIFAPAGTCVYDLYRSEYGNNPRSPVLAEIAPKVRGVLAPAADDAFARWYKDSDNTVNWEGMERTCEFLALLAPDTKLHRMRQLYAIGQQSIDSRDYARALSSYEEALKLDASWVLALNGIGKIYMIESSPLFNEKLGVAYYERAAAADPQFTWAAKNLGDYAIRKRDYATADRYLRQALATSPQRPSILRALGLVCRKTGRRAEALAYYEQSLVLEKDPEKVATAMKAIAAIRNGAG